MRNVVSRPAIFVAAESRQPHPTNSPIYSSLSVACTMGRYKLASLTGTCGSDTKAFTAWRHGSGHVVRLSGLTFNPVVSRRCSLNRVVDYDPTCRNGGMRRLIRCRERGGCVVTSVHLTGADPMLSSLKRSSNYTRMPTCLHSSFGGLNCGNSYNKLGRSPLQIDKISCVWRGPTWRRRPPLHPGMRRSLHGSTDIAAGGGMTGHEQARRRPRPVIGPPWLRNSGMPRPDLRGGHLHDHREVGTLRAGHLIAAPAQHSGNHRSGSRARQRGSAGGAARRRSSTTDRPRLGAQSQTDTRVNWKKICAIPS
jgi:hypothetical protein